MASKVHRVRFYNPKPQAINCISFNKLLKLFALARADASIEIWDLNYAPYLVRFIPGVENGSVEALGWVGKRLLSTGLSGALIEWDISKMTQKSTVLLTGYAAWCLDVNTASTLVAVGTEQGYINLYSVENDEIMYKKLFDKQEGRIMCCKFDQSGNILITGSTDTIRVWNVETGHAMTRITVSRRQKEVIVWSLAVLSDSTIVSGDSHGRLTFWDSTLGEQIESYTTHKADILSIAVSQDEKNIYCSGMDPTISHFVRVNKGTASQSQNQSNAQWVKNIQRHIHEHDVRGLVVVEDKLVSVGIDGFLTFSSYPPKWVMRMPPMIPTPRSSVCATKKLLLLRYSHHLEVWKLGSYATKDNGKAIFSNITNKQKKIQKSVSQLEQDNTIALKNEVDFNKMKQSLKLAENPVKLVSVRTKHKKQIQCCEMSPSGEFILYATDSDVRMLKLDAGDNEEDQNTISLSKVLINGLSGTCDCAAFAEDSRSLVIHCGDELRVLLVDPEAGATVVQSMALDKLSLKSSSILHLVISKKTSSGSTYIVIADTSGAISVLADKKRKFGLHVALPTYQCVPSAMTVDSQRETLIVAYVDQKVVEYDLANKKFTEWPGAAIPEQWRSRQSAVMSVTVHPGRDAVVFQDDTSLWILERQTQNNEDEPEAKRKTKASKSLGLSVIPIKCLAGFHWVGDDEAVVVEILPENIVSQLPLPVQINNWQIRPS